MEPSARRQQSVSRRASEDPTIGELKFKEFLMSFEVGHVRQYWSVEGLDSGAGVGLTQRLNCGGFPGGWVKHPRVSSDTGGASRNRKELVLAGIFQHPNYPRVEHELLGRVRMVPDHVHNIPEVGGSPGRLRRGRWTTEGFQFEGQVVHGHAVGRGPPDAVAFLVTSSDSLVLDRGQVWVWLRRFWEFWAGFRCGCYGGFSGWR